MTKISKCVTAAPLTAADIARYHDGTLTEKEKDTLMERAWLAYLDGMGPDPKVLFKKPSEEEETGEKKKKAKIRGGRRVNKRGNKASSEEGSKSGDDTETNENNNTTTNTLSEAKKAALAEKQALREGMAAFIQARFDEEARSNDVAKEADKTLTEGATKNGRKKLSRAELAANRAAWLKQQEQEKEAKKKKKKAAQQETAAAAEPSTSNDKAAVSSSTQETAAPSSASTTTIKPTPIDTTAAPAADVDVNKIAKEMPAKVDNDKPVHDASSSLLGTPLSSPTAAGASTDNKPKAATAIASTEKEMEAARTTTTTTTLPPAMATAAGSLPEGEANEEVKEEDAQEYESFPAYGTSNNTTSSKETASILHRCRASVAATAHALVGAARSALGACGRGLSFVVGGLRAGLNACGRALLYVGRRIGAAYTATKAAVVGGFGWVLGRVAFGSAWGSGNAFTALAPVDML